MRGQGNRIHRKKGTTGRATGVVVGLDLSLTRTGIAIIPTDWGGDVRRVRVEAVESRAGPPANDAERALRLFQMSSDVRSCLPQDGVLAVGIESLPTHAAFEIGKLGELHGCIRVQLMGYTVLTGQQSTIRKLFMGKLPRKDVKAIVRRTVNSIPGAEEWGPDECDAFVVANWVLGELGEEVLAA
jgi:Holliday junction resolvasome RuvABC endonuclease subunit